MDNLGILVQAILSLKDTTSSKNQIAKELPKLESQLQSDKNTRVKIVAGLDIAKSKNLIQSQLNTLANQAKAPAIKVGIDISGLNSVQGATQNTTNNLKNVQTQAQQTASAVNNVKSELIKLDTTSVKSTSFKMGVDKDGIFNLEKTIENARNALSKFGKVDLSWLKDSAGEVTAITAKITDATGAVERFHYALNEGTQRFDWTGSVGTDSGVEKLIQSMQKAQDKVKALRTNLTADLKSIRSAWEDVNGGKSVKSDENIERLKQQYVKVTQAIRELRNADDTTLASMKANADAQIDKLNQMVTQYHNAEKVATQLRAKGFETVKIDTGNNIDKFINSINNSKVPIQSMQTEINKLTSDFAQLDTIQDQAGKSAALTNILNTLDNAKTKFQSLKELFKGFGNADWLSVNSEQINKINDMATKIAIYKNNLTATRDEWKLQGIYVGEIQAKVTSLARSLPNIKKPEKFNEWVQEWNDINQKANQLKVNLDSQVTTHNKIYEIQSQIAKLNPTKDSAEITRLNEKLALEQKTLSNLQMQSNVYTNLLSYEQQEKYITEQTVQARDKLLSATNTGVKQYQTTITNAITELQGIANSAVFRNNASNPAVTRTKQEINSLITAYQNLATKLQGNITPAGLETVRTELTQLNARFNDATTTAKRFETELRSDNSAEQLSQKVALLTSRIKAYRQANSKSEKMFGSQYDSMLSQLANPNIDLNAYNAINKQFQRMRQEINSANVAGKNLWQTLKEKVAKFTGWMSMTYAVSMFTRSIRQALTELKEVDTVLTEISKANDKLTDSQLAQIGSNSFGIASKYGKTATDYLTGVQEMSRAGYANAEAMGELSTAAQGAGDMTADVANQFIIAADKAYKMNGSVEELTKTLDGINYITNNNAVNMSELSEGFSIVSSTAASFGVGADELTAALGTMAATTQQSGSEVARAFRAILLNIRQVSDEEENIDAEGLTKYEKACNALGVSLKEVKDGVLQLRDPMQVLKELSIEYNKLSETDLKRTNLLNSVGGKLRSTQLDALLRQWSMYEEMLQQYEAGSGSMAREAEKTANSLEGSLNRLSNTWTDTIENIANSESLTNIVNGLNGILTSINNITKTLGGAGSILAGTALFAGLKNVGELLNTPVYAQPQLICA